jgi:hypothetical protein
MAPSRRHGYQQMADDVVDPPPGRKPDPPTDWMGTDDASNQVVQIQRELARRTVAVSGLAASTTPVPLQADATLAGKGSLSADAQVVTAGGDTRSAQPLSDQPAEIRDAARVLSQAIKEQITELRAERRNDNAELIDFLEMVARELDKMVEALDRAIDASATTEQQGIFLGDAKRYADQLKTAFDEALPSIAQFSIKLGVVAAGAIFLQHICGLDPNIAAVTSIVNATFPRRATEGLA